MDISGVGGVGMSGLAGSAALGGGGGGQWSRGVTGFCRRDRDAGRCLQTNGPVDPTARRFLNLRDTARPDAGSSEEAGTAVVSSRTMSETHCRLRCWPDHSPAKPPRQPPRWPRSQRPSPVSSEGRSTCSADADYRPNLSRMTRYRREMKWSIIRRQYAPAILWGSAV